jgi:exopolysaccharide biosynthesis WecB/TagA/CpsF family protein
MDRFRRYKLFLPKYCALPCAEAAEVIVDNAGRNNSFGVAALAVHGLIESMNDPVLGAKINKIKMIVPDGQPIVWALNAFYNLGLKFKVPGPTLTLEVLKLADKKGLKVFLYGSTPDTLELFQKHIDVNYPDIEVVGLHADRFREATVDEDKQDIDRINSSGAHIVLVGRGCPRQEHWVSDHVGKVNAAMLAVGAAFDYHAGKLSRAPYWVQKSGLEWLFRLIQEPRRLWRRYLFTNMQFMKLCIATKLRNQVPPEI